MTCKQRKPKTKRCEPNKAFGTTDRAVQPAHLKEAKAQAKAIFHLLGMAA